MTNPSTIPVSVIIANYNSGGFLDECIRSINSGQWPAEIVVVDDCSTDSSAGLAESLQDEFSNVRVIRLPENGGAAAARKAGIWQAACDWIAVVDADDCIEQDAIACALDQALQDGSEMCIWQLWRLESGREWPLVALQPTNFPLSGRQAVVDTFGKWRIHPLGVARKFIYQAAYVDFSENAFNADELLTRLVFAATNQVSLCDKRYFYRLNQNSTSQKKRPGHLAGLDSAIWLIRFSKKYPEVPLAVTGKRAISYAWRVFKHRSVYGGTASRQALARFVPMLSSHGELHEWLWRHPKHLAQLGIIRVYCRFSRKS